MIPFRVSFDPRDFETTMASVCERPSPLKHAVKTFRVGVVEEKDVHWIVWRAERS
jgi:hypothetical protein